MPSSIVMALVAGALVLGGVAVIVDRLNFPQRRFVPKRVKIDDEGDATRDRTGAHIVDLGDEGGGPTRPQRDNG